MYTGREAEGGRKSRTHRATQRMVLAKVQALPAGAGFEMGPEHSPLTAKMSPYVRTNLDNLNWFGFFFLNYRTVTFVQGHREGNWMLRDELAKALQSTPIMHSFLPNIKYVLPQIDTTH